jgi:hypothetical protein
MSLLRSSWITSAATVVANVWRAVLDGGWALWHEVTDGYRRLSWWVLLGLAWLDGVLFAHWLL